MQVPTDIALIQLVHQHLRSGQGQGARIAPFRELDRASIEQAEHDWVSRVLFDPALPESLATGRRLIRLLRGLPECALAATKRKDLELLVPELRRSVLTAEATGKWLGRIRTDPHQSTPLVLDGRGETSVRQRGLPWLTRALLGSSADIEPAPPPVPDPEAIEVGELLPALALVLAPGLHLVDLREMLAEPVSEKRWGSWLDGQVASAPDVLGMWAQHRRIEESGRPAPPWTTRLAGGPWGWSWKVAETLLARVPSGARAAVLRRMYKGLRGRYKTTANDEYNRAALAVALFAATHLAADEAETVHQFQLARAIRRCVHNIIVSRCRLQPWSEALLYRRLAPLLTDCQSGPAANRIRVYQAEYEAASLLVWSELNDAGLTPSIGKVPFRLRLDAIAGSLARIEADLCTEPVHPHHDRLRKERMVGRVGSLRGALLVLASCDSAAVLRALTDLSGPNGIPKDLAKCLAAVADRRLPKKPDFLSPLMKDRHELRRSLRNGRWFNSGRHARSNSATGDLAPWFWLLCIGVAAAEHQMRTNEPILDRLDPAADEGAPLRVGFGHLAYWSVADALLLCEEDARLRLNLVLRSLLGLDVRCAAWKSADRSYLRPVWEALEPLVSPAALLRLHHLEVEVERRNLLAREPPGGAAFRQQIVDLWPPVDPWT